MTILQLLAQSSYITYNKLIAKEYSVELAILLGAMCSYQTSWGEEFYKTRAEISEDTALSDYAIRKATDELVINGMLTVTLKGCPAKNYYTVNVDVVANKLVEINEQDVRNQRTSKLETTNYNDTINNKEPIRIKEDKQKNINIIKEIVAYFNEKTGHTYKYQNADTQKHIKARLNEGYTIDDFKLVIDHKYNEWHNNEKMKEYLKPNTLFALKHFEGYLQSAKSEQSITAKSENSTSMFDDFLKATFV